MGGIHIYAALRDQDIENRKGHNFASKKEIRLFLILR